MDFEKESLQAVYLTKEGGDYSLRGKPSIIQQIESRAYERVIILLEKSARSVGQAGRVSTERGDVLEVLYNGALITVVNHEKEFGMGRGIEIEAESKKGLEKVIGLLGLPKS
ncbi:hypothetical protein J4416_04605 [Candidatus Pacearchaeota archaeon]|nr:hypothetical protein [Candidatus Pacearchaeota archaeon]